MKLIFMALLLIGLSGCDVLTKAKQRPYIDVKLIGVWKGEHKEKGGTVKSWTQTRKADGTYTIEFSFTEINGRVQSFTESGRWWIMGDLFHEISSTGMEKPDRYQYQFRKMDCVTFVLVGTDGLVEEVDNYEFSECFSKDSPLAGMNQST